MAELEPEPPQDTVTTNGGAVDGAGVTEVSETETKTPTRDRRGTEPDAQAMVIDSLRSQIQDLFSQVSQLNNKLVKSYDRVSDLEDNLHVTRSTIRSSTLRIAHLELERTQHLSALNTGLLVEKSHVTAELTRLMEKATEEAAQRGQAESARRDIEKDLDDLSANLFSQANTMVAEARYARALSERKVEQAELSLKSAEEAVATMQQQVQALQEQKEESDRQADEMRIVMGKGKWAAREPQTGPNSAPPPLRLMSSHQPYQEFLFFVAHLRSIHPSSPSPPAMSTLLTLPFLARLLTEESEPTVRLDLAPSLNWLSRRSVLSAIHNGQVVIEPVSLATLLNELLSSSHTNHTPMIPGINNTNTNVFCALCGTLIFSPAEGQSSSHNQSRPPSHPLSLSRSWNGSSTSISNSWTASNLFKNPLSYSTNPSSKPQTPPKTPSPPQSQTVHIFRLSVAISGPTSAVPAPASLPLFTSSPSTSQAPQLPPKTDHSRTSSQTRNQSTVYPLCMGGWCLTRLRTTCSLWAFVRTGIVDKVWEEEVPAPPVISVQSKSSTKEKEAGKDASAKPPIPPRRRGLWGMASAFGERAASWGEGDKDKAKENGKILPPPPTHPAIQRKEVPTNPPPPLPKRSDGRRVPPPVYNLADGVSVKPSSTSPSPAPQVNGSEEKDAVVVQKADDQPGPKKLIISTEQVAPPSSESEPEPESFLTPTEEIPALADTAMKSPEAVDAITPTAAVAPASLPESHSPVSAPVALHPGTTVNGSDVVRSASPVPPPLPRRAAARGPRPVSSRGIAQSSGPNADMAVSDASTSVAAAAVPAADSSDAPVKAKTEGQSDEDGPRDRTESSKEEKKEEETSEGKKDAVPVNGVNGESGDKSPTSELVPTKQGAVEDDTKTVMTNGHVEETNGKVVEVVSDGVGGEVEGDRGLKGSGEDGAVYIGDATWEERTWKEVVRLREDMFWARVGGLR